MTFDLRPDFVDRVRLSYGNWGTSWIKGLPELVERAAAKWELTEIDPNCSAGWSFVAYARRGGERVVLKLVIIDSDMAQENRALRHYEGSGAVRLLEEDFALRASLLEWCDPGHSLKQLESDEERIEVAIEVLKRIHRQQGDLEGFPVFCEKEREYFARGEGVIAKDLLGRAVAIFDELAADSAQPFLVHGDFHPENILFSEKKGWQLIDPDGLVADREFDAATMVRNELWAFPDPLEVALRRAARFGEALALDRERLWKWAFSQAVLAACWGIEDRDTMVPQFLQAARTLESVWPPDSPF